MTAEDWTAVSTCVLAGTSFTAVALWINALRERRKQKQATKEVWTILKATATTMVTAVVVIPAMRKLIGFLADDALGEHKNPDI